MSTLTSRLYSTRSQNIDDTINTSSTTSSVATSENITILETKLLSRFLNVKDVITKNLQSENERLRQKLSIIILKPIKIC